MTNKSTKSTFFTNAFNVSRIVFDVVNITPFDISAEDLLSLVKNLNKELNAMALKNNPKLSEHYDLIKNKEITDRKYQFGGVKKLVVKSQAQHGSVIPN